MTLSFADASAKDALNACKIMQALFGPLAGGHKGIAGTPRDSRYDLSEANRLAKATIEALNA